MTNYYDSCPECASLNVRVQEGYNDNGAVMVTCHECGALWEDYEDWK